MDSSQPLAPAQPPIPAPTPEMPPVEQKTENIQPIEAQPAETTPVTPQPAPAPAEPKPAAAPTMVSVPEIKAQGPEFFGYRPPKWANDFEHVRGSKGKGDASDSETWLLFLVDRLLKKHSV
jgi:hypothetical protein